MANTSSAKKAARQMIKRTEVNKSRRSQLKAYVRKVEEALASGDKAGAVCNIGSIVTQKSQSVSGGLEKSGG